MSALGQKQTGAAHKPMSAKGQKRTLRRSGADQDESADARNQHLLSKDMMSAMRPAGQVTGCKKTLEELRWSL